MLLAYRVSARNFAVFLFHTTVVDWRSVLTKREAFIASVFSA